MMKKPFLYRVFDRLIPLGTVIGVATSTSTATRVLFCLTLLAWVVKKEAEAEDLSNEKEGE